MSALTTLLLSRFAPESSAGGAALRNLQNLHGLARLGPVDVLFMGSTPTPIVKPADVRHLEQLSLPAEPSGRSLYERARQRLWYARRAAHPLVERYWSGTLERQLQQFLAHRHYDAIVIEELSLSGYLPVLRRTGARLVFDAHNVESRLRTELAGATEQQTGSPGARFRQRVGARRLFEAEQQAFQGADLVWACSDYDAHELQRLYGTATSVTVVPNGLNVAGYEQAGAIAPDEDWRCHPLTVSFLGTYSYWPNEDAALRLIKEVLPLLQRVQPEARLLLIGRDPSPAMQAAADAARGVVITGAVPSILPHLREPSVLALPIAYGSGTRLKVLEAFASRRPVVSTRKGAEGIDAHDGEHLLLRESPEEIADAVLRLWQDQGMRAALCRQAHHLVRQRYSWDTAALAIAHSLDAAETAPPPAVEATPPGLV